MRGWGFQKSCKAHGSLCRLRLEWSGLWEVPSGRYHQCRLVHPVVKASGSGRQPCNMNTTWKSQSVGQGCSQKRWSHHGPLLGLFFSCNFNPSLTCVNAAALQPPSLTKISGFSTVSLWRKLNCRSFYKPCYNQLQHSSRPFIQLRLVPPAWRKQLLISLPLRSMVRWKQVRPVKGWPLWPVLENCACAIPQAQQLSGLRELLKVFHQTLHPERSPAIPMTAQRRRVINKLINTQRSHPSPSPAGVSFMSSPEKCALDNETIDTLVRQVWVEAYFLCC